ncbi:MAG: YmdB family metallophosphoesterase, partial [Alicyclobacillus sp.]|nr:YmdB family metallophosphoesterase [Alicyclobacillus sp.]
VGMVGPRDGILGMDREQVLQRLLSPLPVRFQVAGGARQFCAVVLELDDESGRAKHIERIQYYEIE